MIITVSDNSRMINANDFLVYFIIAIFKFRSTGEGEIIPVG